jgi:Coenzyme PQQ synthesis protein D (PqqD)
MAGQASVRSVETPALAEDTVIARAAAAVEGDLPEETVLLRVDSGAAVRVNRTGAWLWAELAEPLTVGGLAQRLAERHGIESDRALADVRAFAADLAGRGFLVLEPAAGGSSDVVA